MIRADEIHQRLGSSWPQILVQLGIPESALRNKHGPCPACGGKDRFRFDNKQARGTYFCGQCGAGDGFSLLERVHGWTFAEARNRVIAAAGLSDHGVSAPVDARPPTQVEKVSCLAARPPDRVLRLRRDCCAIENCNDAVEYLASRRLWPLPQGCKLKGHATAEYFHDGRRVGRYPAIIADVVDVAGELVTVHTTYLQSGKKLAGYEPRKIMSPMTGREGCAVRLMPATDVLGIAEGIETALSAAAIDEIPVWAALNTALLARFEPPPGVTRLRLYADRDVAGLSAVLQLFERLQGRIRVETRIPPAPTKDCAPKDWNDVLLNRNGRRGGEGHTYG